VTDEIGYAWRSTSKATGSVSPAYAMNGSSKSFVPGILT